MMRFLFGPKKPPPPKLLYDIPWRTFHESAHVLEESVMRDIKKLEPMKVTLILLLGPVNAGKSSFINSCLSVCAGRKKALAQTGSETHSYTLELKSYKDDGPLKNFRFVDSMGVEPVIGEGFHTDDITNLLQGHVRKNYKFDPLRAITTESKFYRKKPKFEHKTQCVVFVLTAQAIYGGIPQEFIDKIQILQKQIKREDVQRVLILTKIDLLCDKVKEDATNIFKSLKVEKAVKMASEMFSIEMASIHPVINYEEEFVLTTAKNIPILLALRQIMQYACDRVNFVLQDSESEDNDSD